MYFREPEQTETVAPGIGYAWAIGLCTAGTIAFGVAPRLALSLAQLGSVMLR
jgi:NADH-quinone oxidoreductase subunit N